MQQKTHCIHYQSFGRLEELTETDANLVQEAMKVRSHAYAPYSKFTVCAAIRLVSGEVVTGTNQENAAFGCGICAERTALYALTHKYPNQTIDSIAVVAYQNEEATANPITPCGLCRQSLLEVALKQDKPIRVILFGKREILVFEKVEDLVPFYFTMS